MKSEKKLLAIQAAWNSSSQGNFDSLDAIYAEDIQFEDPIATGRGLEELKKHFSRIFRGLSNGSYSYRGSTTSQENIVMEWTLHAEIRASGKAYELPGISCLELDPESGKIVHSREYFDLGKGLYEHVPVLGYIIRKVRQRLQPARVDRPVKAAQVRSHE